MLIDTGHCSQTQPWEGTFLVYGGPERLSGAQPLSAAGVNFSVPARGSAEPSAGYTCGASSSFVSGDFDGDGFSDLVFVNPPVMGASIDGFPVPDDFENGGLYLFYGRSQRFTSGTSWTSADAHLTTSGNVLAVPTLDANGDGLADLIIGSFLYERPSSATYWLPGSHDRLSGTLALAAHATELPGAQPYAFGYASPSPIGDLDGDGLGDVLLMDENAQAYLFYGAPGLFQNGVDLGAAAATFAPDPRAGTLAFSAPFSVIPAGDRDGDGDSELALLFSVPGAGVAGVQTNVVLLSGQRQRLSGSVSFPIDELLAENPAPRFDPATDRYLTNVFPAGDLDGDGAADLFTVSEEYVSEDGGYTMTAPQLHIHYGTPVAAAPASDAPR
jgi:hypothetical protein